MSAQDERTKAMAQAFIDLLARMGAMTSGRHAVGALGVAVSIVGAALEDDDFEDWINTVRRARTEVLGRRCRREPATGGAS